MGNDRSDTAQILCGEFEDLRSAGDLGTEIALIRPPGDQCLHQLVHPGIGKFQFILILSDPGAVRQHDMYKTRALFHFIIDTNTDTGAQADGCHFVRRIAELHVGDPDF